MADYNFFQTTFSKLRESFFTKSHTFYPDSLTKESVMQITDVINIYENTSRKQEEELYDRIAEYEKMEKALPILDSIYTLYADECTIMNTMNNKVIWAEHTEEKISGESNELLQFLEIENDIWAIAYNLVSKGNAYAEIVISTLGVSRLRYYNVLNIKRMELPDGTLIGFAYVVNMGSSVDVVRFMEALKYKKEYINKNPNTPNKTHIMNKFGFYPFAHFEMVHWRLRKYDYSELYGFSVMDSYRGHWKSNVMAKASLLMNRILRSVPRRKISVDVGKETKPNVIASKLRQFGEIFKRKRVLNAGGELKTIFDPMGDMEDLLVPTNEGKPVVDVEENQASDVSANIQDVEYFDKVIEKISLIPNSFFSGENASRSSVAQESLRFAKRIETIQKELARGFELVLKVHLLILGHDLKQLSKERPSIKMNFASDTAKLVQIEAMTSMLGFFQAMENIFPDEDRYYKAFGYSKQEYLRIKSQLIIERKEKAKLEKSMDSDE